MEFLIYNLDNMFERFFVFLKNRNIIYELFFYVFICILWYKISNVKIYIIVLKFYVYIRFLLWENKIIVCYFVSYIL